jgi:quinoprotein relay system zinc metallohydrolase 2
MMVMTPTRRAFMQSGLATATVAMTSHRAGAAPALAFEEIASGVFVSMGVHELSSPRNEGNIANVSFIVGNDAVAVVDTGGSARVGTALSAAIRRVTERPVRYVINTHMHPDHVFGNAAFAAPETIFVGHAKLPRGLAARGERYLATGRTELGPDAFEGTRLIPSTQLVAGSASLDLGGRVLALTAHKTAHTDNDLTVRDESTGTLFLGDLLFSGHVPTMDGSIRGWLAVLGMLRDQPAARVVPGHGPTRMGWPRAIVDEVRYFETLVSDVSDLIKRGKTLDDAMRTAGQAEKDAWLLFDEFHQRNVSAVFAELEWE